MLTFYLNNKQDQHKSIKMIFIYSIFHNFIILDIRGIQNIKKYYINNIDIKHY